MELYILTFVNTAVEFDCSDAKPFASLESAQNEMKHRIQNFKDEFKDSFVMIDSSNWYSIISLGGNRAYFNIIREELSDRSIAIHKLTRFVVCVYGCDCFGENLLNKFLDECREDDIIKYVVNGDDQDITDFFNEHIIGECLYENSAEKLGGKVDAVDAIFEFLNGADFMPICKNNNPYYTAPASLWIIGMCEICKGNENIINETRKAIDKDRRDKIFFDYEEAKKQLCKNHMELSDKLSYSDYMSVCEQICGTPLDVNENSCCDMVEKLYIEFYKRVYAIAKKKGINILLENFPSVFEVRTDFPVNFHSDGVRHTQLVIVADAFEAANAIDTLENHINFQN